MPELVTVTITDAPLHEGDEPRIVTRTLLPGDDLRLDIDALAIDGTRFVRKRIEVVVPKETIPLP
jgi:hypothetical protein